MFTLGSASPRRSDLLASIGLQFTVEAVAIDEAALVASNEPNPRAIVERIARAKFDAFPMTGSNDIVLTADTMVACDGAVLGKPYSNAHLIEMLHQMSGHELHIATAVCVGPRGASPSIEVVSTQVLLRELTMVEINRYVDTGVGMDKAGGLALQAEAMSFMKSVTGCWSSVLGLPLCAASRLLRPHLVLHNGSELPAQCSTDLCGRYDR